jgi:hypothetical protein
VEEESNDNDYCEMTRRTIEGQVTIVFQEEEEEGWFLKSSAT